MPITNRNTPVLHQRVAQLMNPINAVTTSVGTGAIFVSSDDGLAKEALVMNAASTVFLYNFEADTYQQVANSGLTFGAGACGYRSPWSNTYTATGGSTTTIALSSTQIRNVAIGATIEFLTGANAGVRTTVSDVIIDNAATTIIVPTLSNAVANNDTFRMNSGRFFVVGGGTSNTFRSFDVATATWSSALATTPATIATDARLTGVYIFNQSYATGTATSGTANTLVNSAKTWTTNQWANYQVRITAGTGLGQIRVISSNTGTTLTVASNWTTNPDATSEYAIEGDEDKLYLAGNNATAFYRYSISGNSWATLTPTQALTTNRAAGMTLNFIGDVADADWSNESVNRNGRYLWSIAGGSSNVIARYDIAANTWVNGISIPTLTSFATTITNPTMATVDGRYIYLILNATGIIYRFDAVSQTLEAYSNINYVNGNTGVGNRMFIKKLDADPTIKFVYIQNGANLLFRQLIY